MKERRLDALSLHHSKFLVRYSLFPLPCFPTFIIQDSLFAIRYSLPRFSWIQKTLVNCEGLAAQNAIGLLGRQWGMGNERAREMDGDWTGE